jgi:O-antigen biosynthesis protein
MEFTGERYVPTVGGAIALEHLHRYAFSMGFAKGRCVLDIACGEGYGSNLLAQVAQSVVGVDISPDAVAHASKTYGSRSNVRFLQGDCTQIPLDALSVDLVVSFETIEHHARHEEMVSEIRRVLRKDGLLLISSPNRQLYSGSGQSWNPHHVKELYFHEFSALLASYFRSTTFFGQQTTTASFLFPLDKHISRFQSYSQRNETLEIGTGPLQRPLYFLALCTNSDEPHLPSDATVYFNHNEDLFEAYVRETLKVQSLESEVARLKSTAQGGKC